MFSFQESKVYLLDGAVGSLLEQRYVNSPHPLWASGYLLTKPDAVAELHKEYVDSGADIITANTFRTNPAALRRAGMHPDCRELVRAAVNIAREAGGKCVTVAGSNPPAEDCYSALRTLPQAELEMNHYRHIDALMESGADFILCETFSHFDEIICVAGYCSAHSIPFVISLFVLPPGHLLSGESVHQALEQLAFYTPLAVGLNCISLPDFERIFPAMKLSGEWGFYLNCGSRKNSERFIHSAVTAKEYTDFAAGYLGNRPQFIGSCCGSTPEHTKQLRALLDAKNNDILTRQN